MSPTISQPGSGCAQQLITICMAFGARGLAGTKPEEAYRVWIGLGETMTQDNINEGQMIVKVGMAAVRPAEFIILQFTQDVAQ